MFLSVRISAICSLLILFFFFLNIILDFQYVAKYLSGTSFLLETSSSATTTMSGISVSNINPRLVHTMHKDNLSSNPTTAKTIASNINTDKNGNDNHNNNIVKCEVYIAPSTVPNAGLGVYSGVDVLQYSPIGHSTDIMIPVGYYLGEPYRGIFINDYSWMDKSGGNALKTIVREEGKLSLSLIPNFGSIANHFAIPNIDFLTKRSLSSTKNRAVKSNKDFDLYDDWLYAPQGPTYGSFTPYHNYQVYAQRNINAGQELFMDYGEAYFSAREDQYGKLPRSKHYYIAERIITQYHNIILQHYANNSTDSNKGNNNNDTTTLEGQLWNLLRTYARPTLKKKIPQTILEVLSSNTTSTNSTFSSSYTLVTEFHTFIYNFKQRQQDPSSKETTGRKYLEAFWNIFHKAVDPYLRAALPTTFIRHTNKTIEETLDDVISAGGILNYMDKKRHSRSTSWLQDHGVCVDHLRVSGSTMLDAGRGAFSKYFLPKGSVITPCPLIQMHKFALEKNITTWDFVNNNGNATDQATISTYIAYKKLLLNYCFGHPKSSIRLCPYGSACHLINHASTKDKINAEIRWSSSPSLLNSSRLGMSPNELLELNSPARIAYDIVATRDIPPGEEIFIYYGKEWEDAREKYKREWNDIFGWPHPPPQFVGEQQTADNSLIVLLPDINDLDSKNITSKEKSKKTACYYNFEASAVIKKIFPLSTNAIERFKHIHEQRQQKRQLNATMIDIDDFKATTNTTRNSSQTAYRHDNMEYKWAYQHETTQNLGGLYPCDVYFKEEEAPLFEEKGKSYFSTRIYPIHYHPTKNKYQPRNVRFVPRNAIVFVNDQWLEASKAQNYSYTSSNNNNNNLHEFPKFRHYIVIPDHILPTTWIDEEEDDEKI